MIEVIVQPGRGNAFPAAGVVARLAALVLETSLVRIGVAIVAFAKRKSLVTGSAARIRRVALLAFHLLVQASQRVSGLVVIELSGSVLPIHKIVTLEAIGSQTPFVEIFVAGGAGLRNSEE